MKHRRLPRITIGHLKRWMAAEKVTPSQVAHACGFTAQAVFAWLDKPDDVPLLERNSRCLIASAMISGIPGLIDFKFIELQNVQSIIRGFRALEIEKKDRTIADAHSIAEARALSDRIFPRSMDHGRQESDHEGRSESV